MEILFVSDKLQKTIENFPLMKKKFGIEFSKKIKQRLDQLEAFVNLQELFESGIDNPHILNGDLNNNIGWDINKNYRLILGLIEPPRESFMKDMKEIVKVIFKGVVDYHGTKNNWIIH